MAKKQFNKKRGKTGDSNWQPSQDQISDAAAEYLKNGGKVTKLVAEDEPVFSPVYRSTGQSLVNAVDSEV